MQVMI